MGERFSLFAPQRTEKRFGRPNYDPFPAVPRFSSQVVLDAAGVLPSLPVFIDTVVDAPYPSQAFMPFTPTVGYQVTREDFDPALREEKINRPPYLNATPVRDALSSLDISVHQQGTLGLELLEERTPRWGEMVWDFRPDVARMLSQLRLQVFANGLRFEGSPQLNAHGGGSLRYYRGFYPFDSGPLAVPETPIVDLWHEGLSIALPADRGLLSQVAGRFVLAGY